MTAKFADVMRAHPVPRPEAPLLNHILSAISDCAGSCTACADACLAEAQNLQMLARCIRICWDCADVCDATQRILTRQTACDHQLLVAQLKACIAACETCEAECRSHAMHHAHCAACAESCRRGADAAREMLEALRVKKPYGEGHLGDDATEAFPS